MHWPSMLGIPADPPIMAERSDAPTWLINLLLLIQGVAWIYAYGAIIYRTRVDRWLGVPLFAVTLNLSWELTFLIVLPNPQSQKPIDLAWALLDVFVLWLAFQYGWKDYPGTSPGRLRWLVAGALAYGFVFHLAMGWEFADDEGIYGALAINLYMSIAYVQLLRRRGSSVGQTMPIAVAKMIGTLGAGLMFFAWYPGRNLLTLLTVTIFVIDLVYIRMLHRQLKADGVPTWSLRHPPVEAPVAGPELVRS